MASSLCEPECYPTGCPAPGRLCETQWTISGPGIGYNRSVTSFPPLPSSSPAAPVWTALSRIRARQRLNRIVRVGALLLAVALVVLVTWRLLAWFGTLRPAASALVILLAILAVIALLFALGRSLLRSDGGLEGAAAEADRRAGLKNELLSALWFSRESAQSQWIGMQLERAARSAASIQPERLVPVRLPPAALAALALGAIALAALWMAPPLEGGAGSAGNAALAPSGVQALREMVATMPDSATARQLEQALRTLERPDATPEERRQAIAQAQDAVDRMGMEAASRRDELQKLSEALGNQPGMEKVAEALARGDTERAAQLLEQIQQQTPPKGSKSDTDAEPVDGGPQSPSQEQALMEASQASGAQQDSAPSKESVQAAIERLNEIARDLAASNYVNEAWQSVRGPQLEQYQQAGGMTAGRYAEQTQASSTPSPGGGETPMGGGTMARSAAVAQGDARTEQEGGTRMGKALGDSPADPVLGKSEERLEAQLKQSVIESEQRDDAPGEERTWFYSESQQQNSVVSRREVQARARFAQAEAGSNGGISIQHRQIVKDYFMNLRESAQ